jgi:hypothetical protein
MSGMQFENEDCGHGKAFAPVLGAELITHALNLADSECRDLSLGTFALRRCRFLKMTMIQ